MRTRGIAAAGLFAAVAAQEAPAWAQGNPNTPPGEGAAVNVGVPAPPPADRPLIKSIPEPVYVIDGGFGVLGYIGGTGRLGPSWNVRITGALSRRFAIEGNYVGSVNQRADGSGSLFYNSLDGDIRYNVLRADEAPVQPYVSAGLGWAGWLGPGGTPFSVVIPVSAGVERMLTQRIKIGARVNFRPAFFDNLGRSGEENPPGGDTWSIVGNVGGAF